MRRCLLGFVCSVVLLALASSCDDLNYDVPDACVAGGASACACGEGFVANGSSGCIDVDECASGSDDCSQFAECTNTKGSFECSCRPGSEGDGRDCRVSDACVALECDPPASCKVEDGSGTCVCPDGYELKDNACVDIDECELGTDDCDDDASCDNDDGGFSCTCNAGFAGDGRKCVARMPCAALGLVCAEHATCVARAGTATCECNPGYEGDGQQCQDIDECARGVDDCDPNADCTNARGSVECVCRAGFSGDGADCADIDECSLGTDDCDDVTELCENTAGGWSCACAPGYRLSNGACVALDALPPSCVITADLDRLVAGQVAVVTFTFSEPVSGFARGDLRIDGGVLGPLTGSGTTLHSILTPLANSTRDATVDLAAGRFTDTAGNFNSAAERLTIAVDTRPPPPTVTIASDDALLSVGDSGILTFTLSTASSDFTAQDISVSGGSIGALSGSGTSYSATLTPDPDSTTAATVAVASGAFSDGGGNSNQAAAQLTIEVDTVAPTVLLLVSDQALKIGETAQLMIGLSESADDFAQGDITVSGCVLSDFQGSGRDYAALLTPESDQITACVVDVAQGAFSDPAANPNVASLTTNIAVDRLAPSVAISTDDNALKLGEVATLTFTLSEPAADFAADDIGVSGGTIGSFAGNGAVYTATLTPSSDSTQPATIGVAAGRFSDAAGNPNAAATPATIAVDTIAPTVAIASNAPALGAGETATLTFTLSESSLDFDAGDIVVTGGTLGLLDGSGASYSATFTPTDNAILTATVDVPADGFADAAGNANLAATQLTIDVDTSP